MWAPVRAEKICGHITYEGTCSDKIRASAKVRSCAGSKASCRVPYGICQGPNIAEASFLI